MNKPATHVFFGAVLLTSLVSVASAQSEDPIKIETDTAFLGGSVPGNGAYGGGIAVEPKIEVVDNVRVGLRTGVFISGGGSIPADGEGDVSVGVGVNVSALVKAEYVLPTGSVRPLFGFGAGLYYLISQSVSAGDNTSVNQQAGEFFGVAPQVGLEMGRVRLVATYNAILGANVEVTQQVGEPKTFRQDYASVEFGFRF